ncbi:MAG: hypothetical protein E7111_07580 [Bacteroidales bacterium]|nr:hypothetical protein [Bacteroidales bacterium]
MKKFIIFVLSLIVPAAAYSQAQIDTKKVKIADFTQKTTKVVLTGNMLHDASLKNQISARWNISPFEFCTLSEYETIKTDSNYYFLVTTDGQFKKETEANLKFITLVKGGQESLNEMIEVISFPFACANEPSGREYIFLPTILDMIQIHATKSMENDILGYTGLPNYSMNIAKSGDMTIVFSSSDLSSEITPEVMDACFDENILVLDEDDADEYLSPDKSNTLVSYVVAPTDAKPGSYCYKMLFETGSGTLYYFRKHKISKKAGVGFLAEDIKRICTPRRK